MSIPPPSSAQSDPVNEKGVLDIIFSCILCHKTFDDIAQDNANLAEPSDVTPKEQAETINSGHSKERKHPPAWLSSCAHMLCASHFTGEEKHYLSLTFSEGLSF